MIGKWQRWVLSVLCVLGCLASARGQSPIRPGDRVALVGNTYADQLRMHGYLETLLLQRSLEKPVSVRNLGWAGDMLSARDRPTNFPSEEATLREHRTDVIVACFGMGESFAGAKGADAFREELKALIASHRGKKYNGESEVRLILVSPIACDDLDELTPEREERNRDLKLYKGVMGEMAGRHGIPFVNLYDRTDYLMADPSARKLTINGIRLNAYGYWATSRMVVDQLLPGGSGWRLQVDARSGTGHGEGVEILALTTEGAGLQLVVREERFPIVSPSGEGATHPSLIAQSDVLLVKNLGAGSYTLTVEGKAVITAGSEEWEKGVPLAGSPAHQEAEAYRAAVNDKNLHFTYSWKALNQVHIVGERKTSKSGRSLPAEVIAFHKLAREKEALLQGGLKLKTRTWRLVRNPDPTKK